VAPSNRFAVGAGDVHAEIAHGHVHVSSTEPLSLSDLMRDESDLMIAGHPAVDLSPAGLERLYRAAINDAVVTALMHRQAQRRELRHGLASARL